MNLRDLTKRVHRLRVKKARVSAALTRAEKKLARAHRKGK